MRMTIAALRRTGLRIASITPAKKSAAAPRKRRGPTPHDLLWDAVSARYKSAEREFPGAVPGRKFRLDIAITARRLAIEIDGYEFHGKHLNDFKRDRERQNLLVLHGWRVLRFTAADIRTNLGSVMDILRATCAATIRHERKPTE